jgi:hypothetical protein
MRFTRILKEYRRAVGIGAVGVTRHLLRLDILRESKLNKKFWEELIDYFPSIHTDRI